MLSGEYRLNMQPYGCFSGKSSICVICGSRVLRGRKVLRFPGAHVPAVPPELCGANAPQACLRHAVRPLSGLYGAAPCPAAHAPESASPGLSCCTPKQTPPPGLWEAAVFYRAFLGQCFTHSMHRIHSVPFFRWREGSSISTSMGQTCLHRPQEMHLPGSHFILNRAK